MKVANHPYLAGVRLREDGAVWIPRRRKSSCWTFGASMNGYLHVSIAGKTYYVHRLMAEAFLQYPIPVGMQIDHINRDKSLNALSNIRIVTPSENCRNTNAHEASIAMYGVSQVDDRAAYNRACRERYANDSEFRELHRARHRAYYAKKKAETSQK